MLKNNRISQARISQARVWVGWARIIVLAALFWLPATPAASEILDFTLTEVKPMVRVTQQGEVQTVAASAAAPTPPVPARRATSNPVPGNAVLPNVAVGAQVGSQGDRPERLSFVLPGRPPAPSVLLLGRSKGRLAQALFAGGAQSLVARAVGHAEGTRSVTGEPTWAYWGHVDPGNRVWNRGTFSYQHAAKSPEDADAKQLWRLERQAQELEKQARGQGIQLSLSEKLNGIDLANQAPLAALDRGYIDRLAEAKQLALSEADAILWARTWAYWDPDLNHWNAPGLGNTRSSIEADQRRRQEAIAQVLAQVPFQTSFNAVP